MLTQETREREREREREGERETPFSVGQHREKKIKKLDSGKL